MEVKNDKELYERAADLYLAGDLMGALNLFGQYLMEHPHHPYALLNTGKIHYELGNKDLARSYLEEAVRVKPDLYEGLRILADIYTDRGELDRAIETYERLAKVRPTAEVFNNLGYLYQLKGDYKKSIEYFDKAIALKPELAEAYYNKALSFRRLGNFEEALRWYSEAIERNPTDPDFFYNRGIVRKKLGDLKGALEDFKKAVELNPLFVRAYNNMGNVYYALGEVEKALESYRKALDINPTYLDALFNAALVLRESGRCREAIDYYDRILALSPDNAAAMIDKAICLKELGRFDEAERLYRRAMEVDKGFEPLALYNLACLYNLKGEKEKAKELLEKSFQLDPALREYAKTDEEVKDLLSS